MVRWVERWGNSEAACEAVLPCEAVRWSDPADGSAIDRDHSYGHDERTQEGGLRPEAIDPRGNYAVRIVWSDGHEHAFFTYDALLAVARRHLDAAGSQPVR